jgi:hypothetical protein
VNNIDYSRAPAVAREVGATVEQYLAIGAAVEAQVRGQIAADIEALDGEPLLKLLVSINPSAQAALAWAAATARGDS